MKQRDVLLAGALMLGMGLNAQAQEESRLFFFGFEDGMASFTDSTNPLDSITSISYYKGNPTEVGWEIDHVRDSVMYMLNGVSPLSSRGDSYEIIEEVDDSHAAEFAEMGAEGGQKYFKYIAGGQASDNEANNYEADLFIRGVQIENNTSYRLVYYVKGSKGGKMHTDLLRGYYNSEKPLSMTGASGGEFTLHKTEFNDQWERVTMMSYYQNDSVAERHMYNSGYWWTGSWTHNNPETGLECNYIQQFDKYFVRLSFSGPAATYYVDDIALYKSWIGGAESNADIIRINFGYETNLAALAKADVNKAIVLPGEYFSVTGIDRAQGDDPREIEVLSAEYHDDGYMYMWLDDDCDYYEDLRVNFINPEDPALQLKYTGSLYPMALDTTWVKEGKVVPGFSNEFVVPNPNVFANSIKEVAPVVVGAEPEVNSFTLDPQTKSIKVYMSKETYVEVSKGETTEKGVLARMKGSGVNEIWLPGEYDKTDGSVTFTRQNKYTTPLNGDFDFVIMNLRSGVAYEAREDITIKYSFGPADVAPIIFANADFTGMKKGTSEIEGFSVNESCMMEVTDFSGLYSQALKFGLFGKNLPNGAPVLTYEFEVNQPGEWMVRFGTTGCLKNSWNDDCKMEVRLMNAADTLKYYVEDGSGYKPEEGGVVKEIEDIAWSINFENTGKYTLEFKMPNENSWSGGHKGGRILYYVKVSNNYSSAYTYIDKFNKAYEAAKAKQADAFATSAKYTGEIYDALVAVIAKYVGFSDTKPTHYNTVVDSLNTATATLSSRMELVDKYYSTYADAEAKRDEYTEAAEAGLEAHKALIAKINEYATLDATKKTNDEITAITNEVADATKAVIDRVNNNDAFKKALENLLAVIENEENAQYAGFVEFTNAQATYNAEKDDNTITMTDDELAAATKAVTLAKVNFNNKVEGVNAMTVQIKALAELAEALEVDFDALKAGSAAEIKAAVATAVDADPVLTETLKSAIKYTIYKKIAEGELDLTSDSLDVTPFINNYNLYSPAAADVDMEWFNYTYSAPNDRWRVKKNTFETVFPGWTVQGKGGNVHIGDETINWKSEEKAPVFDAYIGLDWSSSVVLTGTVEGLPVGKYSIGVASNTQKTGSQLIAIVGEVSDTVQIATGSSDYVAVPNNFVYGVEATEGTVGIKYEASSGEGWSRIDNFAAILTGIVDVEYGSLVEAAKAAAEQSLNSVEAVENASSVKYYNINGVQTAQPKGVTIKVNTGKNGKVNAQKVLVK